MRDVLRTWSRGPTSLRNPLGGGGQDTDLETVSITVPGISCGGGSLLVVGTLTHTVPLISPVTDVSVLFGSEAMTKAVLLVNSAGSDSASIHYLIPGQGGANDLTVNLSGGSAEISLWATEVTLPRSNPLIATSSLETGTGGFTMPPLSLDGPSWAFAVVAAIGLPTGSFSAPMEVGQLVDPGNGFGCYELQHRFEGGASTTISSTSSLPGTPVAAASFRVT